MLEPTDESPLEIEFSEDTLLWFMAFVTWDEEFRIVGLFEADEQAEACITDAALENGYFWMCPLQPGAVFGSDEDPLRDCDERIFYFYRYTERPKQSNPDAPRQKVDRRHLSVIK